MFFLIGLGLGDAKDVTVKGLEIIKKCSRVYLEAYTSVLTVGKEALEEFYGRELIIADRDCVEQDADSILSEAANEDVALLVVGDPFGATTHTDLVLRAKQKAIPYQIVHNASIMNAVGCCGLQLYCFGETVSIPYWTDTWQPDSFYHKIKSNRIRGLHTLCLLDIKVKEPTLESMTKKKKEYMPPRFMSVNEASQQLITIIENERKHLKPEFMQKSPLAYTENTLCVGLARVGSPLQKIFVATLKEMSETDLGAPLHSLIICGEIQPLEEEYLEQFLSGSCSSSSFKDHAGTSACLF
ncbi:Diphthine methyl ester synthase [Frankliniella fusca]|uniref:diphthine methyl ester synthase n=1 Tax=Frankliniella fusca TaxID=407009 RepID=A0AAE1LK06_9NEOP|nr:Diphthine methyl ester synthase [Frankliniella fusca]